MVLVFGGEGGWLGRYGAFVKDVVVVAGVGMTMICIRRDNVAADVSARWRGCVLCRRYAQQFLPPFARGERA